MSIYSPIYDKIVKDLIASGDFMPYATIVSNYGIKCKPTGLMTNIRNRLNKKNKKYKLYKLSTRTSLDGGIHFSIQPKPKRPNGRTQLALKTPNKRTQPELKIVWAERKGRDYERIFRGVSKEPTLLRAFCEKYDAKITTISSAYTKYHHLHPGHRIRIRTNQVDSEKYILLERI